MLVIDRVVCDFCYCVVGQLFNTTAVFKGAIQDLTLQPFFCVCPDCYESSIEKEAKQ